MPSLLLTWGRHAFYFATRRQANVAAISPSATRLPRSILISRGDGIVPRTCRLTSTHGKTHNRNAAPCPVMNESHRLDAELHVTILSGLVSLAQCGVPAANNHEHGGPMSTANIDDSVDSLLVKPLCDTLGITADCALALIRLVCSVDEPLLGSIDPSASMSMNTRFYLLDPHRILTDLIDPLMHVGVQQPHRILATCPELLLASAIPGVGQEVYKSTSNRQHASTKHRRTILTEALVELSCLLSNGDLVRLISRYPGVLVRPRTELTELHAYLTEEMGLQTTEGLTLARTNSYRHAMRHSTGLSLVNCPAWSLPLVQVQVRHSLAVLAGIWPLRGDKSGTGRGDRRLASLLTCPAARVSKWLLPPSDTSFPPSELLSAIDVRLYEAVYTKALNNACDSVIKPTVTRKISRKLTSKLG